MLRIHCPGKTALDWLSPAAGAWERSLSAVAVPCSRALIRSTRMDFASCSQWKAGAWADWKSTDPLVKPDLPRSHVWSDCCFEGSQLSCLVFHNSSVCYGLPKPLAPLRLWQLRYCLCHCRKKERCFTSFPGYYCWLIHAKRCSCRLPPWGLTTHPYTSRHQCDQCICYAELCPQLGAWGSSVSPPGIRRFKWHFHQDFQRSFIFSAALKQQITTNACFKRGVWLHL